MSQPEKQFSDTERLTWLSKNLTVNMGLAPGGYWHRSDLRWQQEGIREAIDKAMRDAGEQPPDVRFGPECDQALNDLYAKFGNNQTAEQKLHIHSLISGETMLHMEAGEAHDEVKLAITEHAWLCAKGLSELELV